MLIGFGARIEWYIPIIQIQILLTEHHIFLKYK